MLLVHLRKLISVRCHAAAGIARPYEESEYVFRNHSAGGCIESLFKAIVKVISSSLTCYKENDTSGTSQAPIGQKKTFRVRDTDLSTDDHSRASAEGPGSSASASSGGNISRTSPGGTPKGQGPGREGFRTMADLAGRLRLTNPDGKLVKKLLANIQDRDTIVIMTEEWKSCIELAFFDDPAPLDAKAQGDQLSMLWQKQRNTANWEDMEKVKHAIDGQKACPILQGLSQAVQKGADRFVVANGDTFVFIRVNRVFSNPGACIMNQQIHDTCRKFRLKIYTRRWNSTNPSVLEYYAWFVLDALEVSDDPERVPYWLQRVNTYLEDAERLRKQE